MQKAFLILKTGGWCGIIIFLAYLAITLIYVLSGTLEGSVEDKLLLIANGKMAWWWIVSLSVLTDFLLFPVTYALYKLLFPLEKDIIVFGALAFVLFAFLDLALTWPSFEMLINIATEYANMPAETSNIEILSMAGLLDKLHSSKLFSIYVILLMSIGIVIFSRAFKIHLHYNAIYFVGLAIGILGIAAVLSAMVFGSTGMIVVLVSILTILWLGMVSVKLLKLSRSAEKILKK